MIEISTIDTNVLPSRLSCFTEEFRSSTTEHSNFLRGVKWSPDGACFLTAAADASLRVFDFAARQIDATNATDLASVPCTTKQAGETTLDGDPYSPVVRLRAGELVYDYAWYSQARFDDPISHCFAVAARSHPIHVYDAKSGDLRCSYRPYDSLDALAPAHSVAFSPDGLQLFAGGRACIYSFDVARPGRDHETLETHKRGEDGQAGIISCLAHAPPAFSPGIMAAGSYAGTAALYDTRTSEQIAVLEGHVGGVTHVRFSADGNYLYSGARRDLTIYCWDARQLSGVLYAVQRDTPTTNQRIYFDIEPAGRHLASGGEEGVVRLYDLRDGKEVNRFKAARDTVNGCEFHPYLRILATASGQRRFALAPHSDDDHDLDDGTSSDTSEDGGESLMDKRIGRRVRDSVWRKALSREENCLCLWEFGTQNAMAKGETQGLAA